MLEGLLTITTQESVETTNFATVISGHENDEIANMDYSDYFFFLAEIEHR